jgi:hypothetical protein
MPLVGIRGGASKKVSGREPPALVLSVRGSFGPVDERDENADDGQREESDGVLYVHLGVSNNVIDVRNEEKHSQRHTNDYKEDAEEEDCRVLHS